MARILDTIQPLDQVHEIRLNGQYRMVGLCPYCKTMLLSGTWPWKELDGTIHACRETKE